MFFKSQSAVPTTPKQSLRSLPDSFTDDSYFIAQANVFEANAALQSLPDSFFDESYFIDEQASVPQTDAALYKDRSTDLLPPLLSLDLLDIVIQVVSEGFHRALSQLSTSTPDYPIPKLWGQ